MICPFCKDEVSLDDTAEVDGEICCIHCADDIEAETEQQE